MVSVNQLNAHGISHRCSPSVLLLFPCNLLLLEYSKCGRKSGNAHGEKEHMTLDQSSLRRVSTPATRNKIRVPQVSSRPDLRAARQIIDHVAFRTLA
jgi:hypothetical protein